LPLPIGDPLDPRSVGSAMSYARRYSVMALLGLAAADEDDDAEKARRNGNHPQAEQNRQSYEQRQGPKPAQRLPQQASTPAGPAPKAEGKAAETPKASGQPIGKIARLMELPSGGLGVTLDTGFKCATKDAEIAKALQTHEKAGATLELTTRAPKDPRFSPIIEEIAIVVDHPAEDRVPGNDDE